MRTGKIYKIIATNGSDFYVGSTFQKRLCDRMRGHKKCYKLWQNGKKDLTLSFILFEKYGIANCKFMLIKEYEVIDRRHLHMYEALWINKLNSCINKKIPFNPLIKCQHFKANSRRKERRNCYECSPEIKEFRKEYYETNKEVIAQKKKAYREENKEILSLKKKDYYENNKEVISEKGKVKVRCDVCDCEIRKCNFKRHQKTKKHQSNLEKNN